MMATAPFFWGAQGQQLTPGQVAMLRQVAASRAGGPVASNLGEGLASIGDALVFNSLNARAAEAETAGQRMVAESLAAAQASGDPSALYGVIADPWATEGQRLVAGSLLDRSQMLEDRAYDEGLFGRQVDARRAAGEGMGLTGDPLTVYSLTGDMASGADLNAPSGYRYTPDGNLEAIPGGPAAQPPKLDAGTKKEIFEADDAILAGQESLMALDEALRLNETAGEGPLSDVWSQGGALFGDQASIDTQNLKNIVLSNALNSLKAIFGAAPTEGERQILLDIQGSIGQSKSVRRDIFTRAKAAAERRLQFNQEKAQGLRSGGYFDVAPAAPTSGSGNGWNVIGVE